MTKINATVVAHSINPQGDELISILATFPRMILAEVNTHRSLSRNTSSSRAIPFKKMVEAVQNDPFVPIAWQKSHSGMQGSEYITFSREIERCRHNWKQAALNAIHQAKILNESEGVTKQLCNRLLEPFMWTTMLITGSKEGWNNFFKLRCPQYEYYDMLTGNQQFFKSKKDWLQYYNNKPLPKAKHISKIPENDVEWLQINNSQAEIHMQALAEAIYDAMNESTPKQLKAGQWHIPFEDKISSDVTKWSNDISVQADLLGKDLSLHKVKVSTAMAARTSYTVVGDEKEIDYQKMIDLHDRLISQNPPHSSPMEHCARAMANEEYYSFIKGSFIQEMEIDNDGFIDISTHTNNSNSFGWCRNFKGFIQYRHIVENDIIRRSK